VRAANSQLRSACAAYYRDNKELAQLLEMHEDFTLNDSDTLESELLFNVIQAALSANVMFKIKAFLNKDMGKRLEYFTEQWENKRKQFAKDALEKLSPQERLALGLKPSNASDEDSEDCEES